MKKVAFSGVEGAFAHVAARKMFPDAMYVSCKDFRAAYDAVVGGECSAAVLPVENNYAGKVREVEELLADGRLHVDAEYTLPIVQNLLGVRGSSLADVKKVISHRKALEQCDAYLKERGYEVEDAVNTAVAAKQVVREQKMSVAAIASLEVAAMYGLKVLAEHINTRTDNMTRFVAVSKNEKIILRSLPR